MVDQIFARFLKRFAFIGILFFCGLLRAQSTGLKLENSGNLDMEEVLRIQQLASENKDTLRLGQCAYWLFKYHLYNGEGEGKLTAFTHLSKALAHFESGREDQLVHELYIEVVDILIQHYHPREALKYANKLLRWKKSRRDAKDLGHLYSLMGQAYYISSDTANFLRHWKLAATFAQVPNDSLLLSIIYTNRGRYHFDIEEFEQAIQNARTAISYGQSQEVKILGWTYCLMAMSYQRLGQFERAVTNYRLANLRYHRNKEKLSLKNAYCNLSRCFEEMGILDSALVYSRRCDRLSDSLLIAEKENKLEELYLEFDKRENERTIAAQQADLLNQKLQLSQQRQKIWLLFLASLTVMILALGSWKFFADRIKTQKEIAEKDRRLDREEKLRLKKQLEVETARSLIRGQDRERKRFARDLHDGLGGMLSALKLQFDRMNQRLPDTLRDADAGNKVRHLLDMSIREIRTIARNTLPEALEKSGIVSAVGDYLATLHDPPSLSIDFQHYGAPQLSEDQGLSVYRIIQELVGNAVRHSGGSEIMVLLIERQGEIVISVEDNGRGFKTDQKQKGMGLQNLSDRAALLGGELLIDSSPNFGSCFILRFRPEATLRENPDF